MSGFLGWPWFKRWSRPATAQTHAERVVRYRIARRAAGMLTLDEVMAIGEIARDELLWPAMLAESYPYPRARGRQ